MKNLNFKKLISYSLILVLACLSMTQGVFALEDRIIHESIIDGQKYVYKLEQDKSGLRIVKGESDDLIVTAVYDEKKGELLLYTLEKSSEDVKLYENNFGKLVATIDVREPKSPIDNNFEPISEDLIDIQESEAPIDNNFEPIHEDLLDIAPMSTSTYRSNYYTSYSHTQEVIGLSNIIYKLSIPRNSLTTPVYASNYVYNNCQYFLDNLIKADNYTSKVLSEAIQGVFIPLSVLGIIEGLSDGQPLSTLEALLTAALLGVPVLSAWATVVKVISNGALAAASLYNTRQNFRNVLDNI